MKRSLESLFDRYRRKGDVAALGQVFDRASPALLKVALHVASSAAEAEDLVQETFLTAIARAENYDGKHPLKPWLVGILRNHARRMKRKLGPLLFSAVDSSDQASEPHVASVAWTDTVSHAIELLPDPYRQVLVLRLCHDKQPAEIAMLLDRTPATVRSQIHRGLERLRDALPNDPNTRGLVIPPAGLGLAAIRESVVAKASLASHAAVASATATSFIVGGLVVSKSMMVVGTLVLVGITLLVTLNSQKANGHASAQQVTSPVEVATVTLSSSEPAFNAQPTLVNLKASPPVAPVPVDEASPKKTRKTVEVKAAKIPARSARVIVLSSLGDPLPDAEVRLWKLKRKVGQLATTPLSVTTTDSGIAEFGELDANSAYVAWTAADLGLVPTFGRLGRNILKPTDDELTIKTTAGHVTWMRAVDEDSGKTIATSTWRQVEWVPNQLAGITMGPGMRAWLGLSTLRQEGDLERVFGLTHSSQSQDPRTPVVTGTIEVSAPGYESRTVESTATRLPSASKNGPRLVRMRRTHDLTKILFVPSPLQKVRRVIIRVTSTGPNAKSVRVNVERGKKPRPLSLPSGTYDLQVANVRVAELVVSGAREQTVQVSPNWYRVVRFHLTGKDITPNAPTTLSLMGPCIGRRQPLLRLSPEVLNGRKTQRFVVPRAGIVRGWIGQSRSGGKIDFQVDPTTTGLIEIEVPMARVRSR